MEDTPSQSETWTGLQKNDIVKIAGAHLRLVSGEWIDKIGLISEVVDDRMIRVGSKWYETDHYDIEVLYRES